MQSKTKFRAVVLGLIGVLGQGLAAQVSGGSCGVAPVGLRTAQPNIFSEQQETWLGKVEADQLESDLRQVRDRSLSAHLQAIADRLVAQLPPTSIQFRVTLVDSDEVNGFSIAGGHVYIMRKLAAVAKSDDELAGVIGHEIGHIASHQFAFETTREMKRLLNVTSIGDEADLRKKYGEMLDAEYRDKHPQLNETDQEQSEADQIGLYAMAAAGYRPAAYAEFWNRVFFVQGKTGSKLGDLLGMTKPDQKRLRSMAAMVAALPKGCGEGMKPDVGSFEAWHTAVVANQAGEEIKRSTALSEVTLTPPLRMELGWIKFSADGKSILAQDASSLFMLSRDPLAVRYRIDADNAMPAYFSPDSQSVTFNTPGLHVEQWSVGEKKMLAVHEMLPQKDCYDTRLSPDGRTLVCVTFDVENWQLGISMLDTVSSEVLWEKRKWLAPNWALGVNLLVHKESGESSQFFLSSVAPDGNTLLFGGASETLAFNFRTRTVVNTGGSLRDSSSGAYAFLGNDQVAITNVFQHSDSGIYSFPDGKKLRKVNMPFTGVREVTDPGANLQLVIFGVKDYKIGIGDLMLDRVVMALKTAALDEDKGTVIGESTGGALVVGQLGNADAKQQKHVDLPLSPLPYSLVAALSKDGKYLALSTDRRGGVWNLADGKRETLLLGFTDASWSDDDTLFVDIPKEGTVERHIAQISMKDRNIEGLTYKVDAETHMRYGRLTDWNQDAKKKTWTLSMYDPATDKVVWSKNFPDKYFAYTSSYGNDDLIFNFTLDSHTAKELLKTTPELEQEAQAVKHKGAGRLIKVLDGKTGDEVGTLVVELPPNYIGTDWLNRAGDLLYVNGFDDRTSVYSLATGKKVREQIGYVKAVDSVTGRVLLANRIGEGSVYDAEGKKLAEYELGDPIRFALFRDGASVVTILTADQKVRRMKVGGD